MQKAITNILTTIIKKWSKTTDIIGIVLTGSYVLGTSTPTSDIDIIIIAKNETIRERGNYTEHGYVVEYYLETPEHLHEQMSADYADNQRTTCRMLITGKSLYVADAVLLEKIMSTAKENFKKEFIALQDQDIEDRKYWLWDSLDGVNDSYASNSLAKYFLCFQHIALVVQIYCVYTKTEIPHMTKLDRILHDKVYRDKYLFLELNASFSAVLLPCLVHAPTIADVEKLTYYAQDAMGGFTIEYWKNIYSY